MRVFAAIIFVSATMIATPALACRDPGSLRGFIHAAPPTNTPDDMLILEVRFDQPAVRHDLPNGHADIGRARVIQVVRGHYSQRTIDVLVHESSCTIPPSLGTQGFIAGRFRQLDNGLTAFAPLQTPRR